MKPRPPILIEVHSHSAEVHQQAVKLGARLGIDRAPASAKPQAAVQAGAGESDEFRLVLSDDGLELRSPRERPGLGLSVDFASLLRRQSGRGGGRSRNQPLVKAVGKQTRFVFDATAGLGQDAVLLASMGYEVIAAERSPIIFALLEDGLRRALADPELAKALGGRLRIIHADAYAVLRQATEQGGAQPATASSPAAEHQPLDFGHLDLWTSPSAIYIDPMFPPKRKASALAKKSIRMVRQIVGDDDDAADLVGIARTCAGRVVVKRPTSAPPLAANPTMSFTGKLARYDVYVQSRTDLI